MHENTNTHLTSSITDVVELPETPLESEDLDSR